MKLPAFRRFSFITLLLGAILFGAKEGTEWYFVHRVLDIRALKEISREFINVELGRAVALGIVEYEFPNHVFIEDLKISNEEDFVSQHLLFKANKVELVLRGVLKGNPSVKAIRVKNAQIELNMEDKISGKLLEYIQKINIPEIRLDNTTISIFKGESNLLEEVTGVDLLIRKEGEWVRIEISDSLLPWPGFRYLKGSFETRIGSNSSRLELEFRNAKAKPVGGLYSSLSPFLPKSGKISGTCFLEQEGENFKVQGKTEFSKVSGIVLQEIPLQEEPLEWKDVDLEHEWFYISKEKTLKETHIFRTEDGNLELQKGRGEKGLRTWDLSLALSNISNFRSFLPVPVDLDSLDGQLKLHWKGYETGNYNDWLKSEGTLNLLGFHWKNPNLDLGFQYADIFWKSDGMYEGKLEGTQFGSPFSMKLKGKFGFKKAIRGDGVAYYPLQGDFNFDVLSDSFILEDYFPIYRTIRQSVREDIKTRMEKLIPEIRFVRTKIFKYFLEFSTGSLKWKSKESRLKREFQNLGNLEFVAKLVPYQSRADAKILDKEQTVAEASANFTYSSDTPYFDIRFQTNEIPWKMPAFRFCGKELVPDRIAVNGTVRFFGNDTLALYNSLNIVQDVKLMGNRWKGTADFPFPLNPGFDFSFEQNVLPSITYYRELSWNSETVRATGYAQSDGSSLRYSSNGSIQNQASESATFFSQKFRENSEECLKE
ncbi:AsmA domain protein [Leptospira perolatii]|uniref:AsmA domain protein n=1 Tax=Leptospira perolatii TaxID=2023191 RepID=A0A2M9ZK36_9LEPT|nr:AsmA domain protein [Leptospira perolatii]PJZ72435.1 AsmA domain protein [Leptospira perolatii]